MGDAEVARAIGRMVEVERLTGSNRTMAAGADRLAGGDEAGVLSTQGSVGDPVTTSLAGLRRPPCP
jgi:hypothetical protein